MKKAYSYLELLVTLGIVAVLLAAVLRWQSSYVRQMKDVQNYYQERQVILKRLAAGDYDRTFDRNGYRQSEIDWRGQRIIKLGIIP